MTVAFWRVLSAALVPHGTHSAPMKNNRVDQLIWLRDVLREDPELFDAIYEIQTASYRRNSRTMGQVWSRPTFAERAKDYFVCGSLPVRPFPTDWAAAVEDVNDPCGFVFGRLLPNKDSRILCIKLSGLAGTKHGMLQAIAELKKLDLPIIAAADPRIAQFASRIGFICLSSAVPSKLVISIVTAYVEPPWIVLGAHQNGELMFSCPDLRDPLTGEPIVHSKRIIFTRNLYRLCYISIVMRHLKRKRSEIPVST